MSNQLTCHLYTCSEHIELLLMTKMPHHKVIGCVQQCLAQQHVHNGWSAAPSLRLKLGLGDGRSSSISLYCGLSSLRDCSVFSSFNLYLFSQFLYMSP